MTETNKLDLWVRETHQDTVALEFRIVGTLFSGRSPYQQVDVVETAGHGRMLLNDGIVMISERDEFVYHEMIAHVPLFVHPSPRRVLIVGGGDGGTAREVLRHQAVERCVMVEIDGMVVDACRRFMPSVACSLDDARLSLHIADGVRYVAGTEETFDVVIVDSTDPIGPATPLFNRDFYQDAARVLAPDGILISQAESPYYDHDIQTAMLGNQRPFFPRLHLYLLTNLTYPGGLWSFGFASRGPCPIADFDANRVAASGLAFQYYNPAVHRAAFALPSFAAAGLEAVLDPVPL